MNTASLWVRAQKGAVRQYWPGTYPDPDAAASYAVALSSKFGRLPCNRHRAADLDHGQILPHNRSLSSDGFVVRPRSPHREDEITPAACHLSCGRSLPYGHERCRNLDQFRITCQTAPAAVKSQEPDVFRLRLHGGHIHLLSACVGGSAPLVLYSSGSRQLPATPLPRISELCRVP